ncbi:unnamed protein product [Diatraea saccharalis]|uniref:tRNA-specific adenosine deaminase 1 n=1 Tax=Diatraea saccharalis TaxID=40085 RepID=A0A9N9REH4_9NEOP|nr:unnamed protein product [Diatraea saccharalis]
MSLKSGHVDEIVEKCIDIFKKLPKNGKPIEKEWTVLSCVLQYDRITTTFEVVSLGTGSKCIGATKMSSAGDILNDSHAEVIARRGFLVYLYDNMMKALEKKESIFLFENNKFKLKDNVEFVFYSSQMPCGDAAIMRKEIDEECLGQVITSSKRQANTDISYSELDVKKHKLDNYDIYRTGAKCLPHSEQDTKSAGANYHLLGKVRTKPGRGDRTLSVSCSDKIARWIHVGVQGALLDMLLLKSICFSSLIFGGGVPYSEESIMRACLKRSLENSFVTSNNVPLFYQASVVFPHIKNDTNIRPAPGSIVWIKLDQMLTEVAVQGKKLGLTKKKQISPDNSLCISKYNLFKKFQQVLMKIEALEKNMEFMPVKTLTYSEAKQKSKRYLEQWEIVKDTFFKTWTIKPNIWNFVIK